jgi:hypothetical protein
MQSEMSRIILGWYMRFDVFAGLMGGFETVLSREWFSSAYEFFQRQIESEPASLKWKIEAALANHRLLATDMSLLFVKKGKGELSPDQFMSENAEIGRKIQEWKTKMDPALQDKRFLVTDFAGARPRHPNSIVDPYLPGVVYSGPLWVMNVATIDWLSIDIMLKYQTALTMKTEPSEELQQVAYTTCQLFEALEHWPGSPPGTIVACQASLGIACLFLPRDDRHSMWARRKLAVIESHGWDISCLLFSECVTNNCVATSTPSPSEQKWQICFKTGRACIGGSPMMTTILQPYDPLESLLKNVQHLRRMFLPRTCEI